MNRKNRQNKSTWTAEEISLLQEYYHRLSQEVLLSILEGKNWADVMAQVAKLKRQGKEFQK